MAAAVNGKIGVFLTSSCSGKSVTAVTLFFIRYTGWRYHREGRPYLWQEDFRTRKTAPSWKRMSLGISTFSRYAMADE